MLEGMLAFRSLPVRLVKAFIELQMRGKKIHLGVEIYFEPTSSCMQITLPECK